MTTYDVVDFDVFDISKHFKFRGITYVVPAYSELELNRLMDIQIELPAASDDDTNKEAVNERNKQAMAVQNKFILRGISKVDTNTGEYSEVLLDDIVNWPMSVKNKAMSMINDQITYSINGSYDDGSKEESAEDVKK